MEMPESTHKLELHRHQPEVDHLHRRPQHEVRLQRGDVHIPQLLLDRPPAPALGHRHGREEDPETERREDELVKDDPLQGLSEGGRLGRDGKALLEKLEPPELERRHAEAVGHEAREALEVEGRREGSRVRNQLAVA